MKRLIGYLTAVAGLTMPSVFAQTGDDGAAEDPPSIGEQPPAENVRGGNVSLRAPGRIVNDARARHTGLRDNRLAYQRSGGGLRPDVAGGDDGSGSGSGASGGLAGLISQFLGSGNLGNLGGLLGGLTGDSGDSTDAESTDTTGTNPNIPSNVTPEAIALLEEAGIPIDSVFPPDESTSTSKSSAKKSEQGGSILQDRWPGKTDARSQDTTPPVEEEEDSFRVRWADAMLQTTFEGLTLAIASPFFVDIIADALRPIFGLEDPDASGSKVSEDVSADSTSES